MPTPLAMLQWQPLKTTALNANEPAANALNPLFSQVAAYINTASLCCNITYTPLSPTILNNTTLYANS